MISKDKLAGFLNELYWMVEHGKVKDAVDALNKLQNDAAVFSDVMPGAWECKECGFVLNKSILSVNGVFANTSPLNEICPNDGKLMVPVTYKSAFGGLLKACETQIKRAVEAEMKHNKVTEMVSRYLVATKGRVSDSWLDGFVECGAVTIDKSYPTGFIAPVKIPTE